MDHILYYLQHDHVAKNHKWTWRFEENSSRDPRIQRNILHPQEIWTNSVDKKRTTIENRPKNARIFSNKRKGCSKNAWKRSKTDEFRTNSA